MSYLFIVSVWFLGLVFLFWGFWGGFIFVDFFVMLGLFCFVFLLYSQAE